MFLLSWSLQSSNFTPLNICQEAVSISVSASSISVCLYLCVYFYLYLNLHLYDLCAIRGRSKWQEQRERTILQRSFFNLSKEMHECLRNPHT